jgi:uncharacterized protein involved in copper resistance
MNRNASLLALSLLLATGNALAAGPQATPAKPAAAQPMDHSKMNMAGMDMAGKNMEGMDMTGMNMDKAQSQGPDFVALDKNKDGKLSKAEFPANHPLAPHFGMLDTNHDGNLSAAEFARHHGM